MLGETAMNRTGFLIASFGTAILVAGCGGSSGGGGGGGGGVSIITEENANEVAAAAVAGAELATDLGEFAGDNGAGGILGGAGNNVQAKSGLSSTLAIEESINETLPCEPGSISVTGTIVILEPGDAGFDPDNLVNVGSGTTLTQSFNGCRFDDTTLNGTVSVAITSLVLNGDTFSLERLTGNMTFNEVSVTEDGEGTAVVNGDLGLDLDASTPPFIVVTINIGSTTVNEDGLFTTLENFTSQETVNENTFDYVTTTTGSMTSSEFGGPFLIETVEPLEGNFAVNEGNPTSGSLLVTADDGSIVRITVINNGANVQIDYDAGNDGTIDQSTVLTWGELWALVEDA